MWVDYHADQGAHELDSYRTQVEHKAAREAIPGFGRPFHKPDDLRPP
jgi:hypothetical protein